MGNQEDKIVHQLSVRLDKFESRMDQISTAIVQLARTEERVDVLIKQNDTLFTMYHNTQKQINDLEKDNVRQSQSLGFFERIGWLVLSAIAAGIGWFNK